MVHDIFLPAAEKKKPVIKKFNQRSLSKKDIDKRVWPFQSNLSCLVKQSVSKIL